MGRLTPCEFRGTGAKPIGLLSSYRSAPMLRDTRSKSDGVVNVTSSAIRKSMIRKNDSNPARSHSFGWI
jgi:hypothetical protein